MLRRWADCNGLNGKPETSLHVGDIPELDEAGAKAAGLTSLLIDRTIVDLGAVLRRV